MDLITDPSIPTDAENTLNIKKDEDSLTVKTPVENTAIDYWTIAHYKCAKIAKIRKIGNNYIYIPKVKYL